MLYHRCNKISNFHSRASIRTGSRSIRSLCSIWMGILEMRACVRSAHAIDRKCRDHCSLRHLTAHVRSLCQEHTIRAVFRTVFTRPCPRVFLASAPSQTRSSDPLHHSESHSSDPHNPPFHMPRRRHISVWPSTGVFRHAAMPHLCATKALCLVEEAWRVAEGVGVIREVAL